MESSQLAESPYRDLYSGALDKNAEEVAREVFLVEKPKLEVMIRRSVSAAMENTQGLPFPDRHNENFRSRDINQKTTRRFLFDLDIEPEMEPPSIKFKQPVRAPQFVLDNNYLTQSVATGFRQPLLWGVFLTAKDGQKERVYRVRVSVPHGGKLRFPLASRIFVDGGLQEMSSLSEVLADNAAMIDNAIDSYRYYVNATNASLARGEKGDPFAGSLGENEKNPATGEDLGYSRYAGQFIKQDPDDENSFSIEADLNRINAVLEEISFAPEQFFSGTGRKNVCGRKNLVGV